jgi:hypothetical protein
MKTSILSGLFLVVLSAQEVVAEPSLIDFPGPGYRLQRELYAPRDLNSVSHLRITPTLFLQKTIFGPGALRTDKPTGTIEFLPMDNPFSEPIRLFENSKS